MLCIDDLMRQTEKSKWIMQFNKWNKLAKSAMANLNFTLQNYLIYLNVIQLNN